MTNEEAKVFLDNLKICINEHPIVADWLVEIENRNDEPSNSEIPNNCEDLQDWKDRMWAEAIVTEPTISKMEQVEDEPHTCDTCKYGEDKHRYAHICNECGVGINNYEPKDEPQTMYYPQVDGITPSVIVKDEPQTDCDGCQHYADKHTADACYECKRSYTDGYVPQTNRPQK